MPLPQISACEQTAERDPGQHGHHWELPAMWPPSWGSVTGLEVTGLQSRQTWSSRSGHGSSGRPGCGRGENQVQDYGKDALRCAEDGK